MGRPDCLLLTVVWIHSTWLPGAALGADDGTASHTPQQVARQIDRIIDKQLAAHNVPSSPLADDAELLRRASLDITGRIPAMKELDELLEVAATGRSTLIDRLMTSADYGQHFGTLWHNLISGRETSMARPPDTRRLADWLTAAFNQNRPWNLMARHILTAQGSHGDNPATIFFTLNGDSRGAPQPNVIAGSTGQLFLGVQLQCAECHDHPFSDWSQEDFWGVAAFFSRVENSGNKGGAKRTITESPLESQQQPAIVIPAASFTNVGASVSARLPFATESRPAVESGTRNSTPPTTPLLREVFADWLTSPNNPFFARNLVNRLWAHFFGRGLVNPLNDFRQENPPSHPELLDLLSREFIASGFDQQHLIRCICQSRAYQRTSRPTPGNADDEVLFSHMSIKILTPEMLLDSLSLAVGTEVLSPTRPPMDFRNPLLPLYSPREQFVNLFRTLPKNGDPTEYTHGVPQRLVLMNEQLFNAQTPVVVRLINERVDAKNGIEHLYLASLSRLPTQQESQDAKRFIAAATCLQEGLDGVLWTLLNRSEFILNH